MATTIGSLFNPLGNALGQILPVLLVSSTSTDANDAAQAMTFETVDGMDALMGVELALCALPLLLSYAFFEAAPPTPPSLSTQMKHVVSGLPSTDMTRLLVHMIPKSCCYV